MLGVFAAAPLTIDAQLQFNLGLKHPGNEWQPYWEECVGRIGGMDARIWLARFGWYARDQGPGLPGDWKGRPANTFIFHFNRSPRNPAQTGAGYRGTAP